MTHQSSDTILLVFVPSIGFLTIVYNVYSIIFAPVSIFSLYQLLIFAWTDSGRKKLEYSPFAPIAPYQNVGRAVLLVCGDNQRFDGPDSATFQGPVYMFTMPLTLDGRIGSFGLRE